MKKSFGAKTLVMPTPVFLIGSYDAGGNPNLMTAAWGGICSSEPPCVAVSIRPGRLTHANILESKAFTVNIPSVSQVKEADFAGLVSGYDTDKFQATGLTPERGAFVNAPLVAEFPLTLDCALRHTFELGTHTQFVGEILDVKAGERVLNDSGKVDPVKLAPLCFSPFDGAYYALGEHVGKAFSVGQPA